jgi:hypothetical protein
MQRTWTCQCCGKQYDTLLTDYAFAAPSQWYSIPEEERDSRSRLSADVCVIDRQDFFIRACIEIPIIATDATFIWGVWVSVSRESFLRIDELWDATELDDEAPKFGWLCNSISEYPETFALKTLVHLRTGNKRPAIELEPTDHPLAVEQREGISITRVEEIAARSRAH